MQCGGQQHNHLTVMWINSKHQPHRLQLSMCTRLQWIADCIVKVKYYSASNSCSKSHTWTACFTCVAFPHILIHRHCLLGSRPYIQQCMVGSHLPCPAFQLLQIETAVQYFCITLSIVVIWILPPEYPSLALSFEYFTINQKFTWRVSKTVRVISIICVLMFKTMIMVDSEFPSSYQSITFGTGLQWIGLSVSPLG